MLLPQIQALYDIDVGIDSGGIISIIGANSGRPIEQGPRAVEQALIADHAVQAAAASYSAERSIAKSRRRSSTFVVVVLKTFATQMSDISVIKP